jgi:hypothetical protein
VGKGDGCAGLTTLPALCKDCHEIWEPQPPENLKACPGLQWEGLTFTFTYKYKYYFILTSKAIAVRGYSRPEGARWFRTASLKKIDT